MKGVFHSVRRRLAVLAATVGILASAVASANDDNEPPRFQGRDYSFTILKPADPVPKSPLYTMRGGVTHLGRYAGKVVLLNLWATWCAACVHELPSLESLQTTLGDDRFTVIALSVDAGGADHVTPYLNRLGVQGLPVLLDPIGRIAEALGVNHGLPWSFLIDHQGRVMGYMKGAAEWNAAEGRALIRYYVERAPR